MPAGDKVKAGPPIPGATDTSYPGVPAGYTVKRQPTKTGGLMPSRFKSLPAARDFNTPQPPRYDETWILRPLQQNWSPEQIADLQQKMVNAGLLKGGYRRGVWDPASQVAYKKLIEHANQSGSNLEQSLKTYADAPEEEGEERAPLVVQLTNPADLSETARAVARRVIGRTLTDDEAGRFVAAYQAMESEAQKKTYETTNPDGSGGTVVAAPSAESAATQRIKDEMPQESADYGYVGRFNEFMQLLGGD